MSARTYNVAGRQFTKVAETTGHESVHIVEHGQFWKGDRSWQHRAVCGASVTGTPVTLLRVTCQSCRRYIASIDETRES
jgi:hypothetical protein